MTARNKTTKTTKRATGQALPASTGYAAPLDYTHPNANMYGCQPCPECKSRFRWPNQRGEVICDDCGLVQELEKDQQHNDQAQRQQETK